MKKNNYRIETDSLGKVKVAKNALYGAQTQRAIDNFKMSGITVSHQLLIRFRLIYMVLWIIFRLTYFKLALGQAQT